MTQNEITPKRVDFEHKFFCFVFFSNSPFEVVQLRQQQRQAEREKERVTTRTKLLEEEHQRQIAYLHQTLRALDQERNLLMVRLCSES